MALSNWDTLAFDTNGDPCTGSIEVNGTTVDIRKNWLYVGNEAIWVPGFFVKPTILQMNEGHITISGFDIYAKRGSQSSILVYAEHREYQEQVEGEPYKPAIVTRMAGIGCYGYKDMFDVWAKDFNIKPLADSDYYYSFSSYNPDDINTIGIDVYRKETNSFKEKYELPETEKNLTRYDSYWVGVEPETKDELVAFLHSLDIDADEWIDKITNSAGLRFNQGDAFFAVNLDIDLPATEPGKAEEPIIMDMLKGINK